MKNKNNVKVCRLKSGHIAGSFSDQNYEYFIDQLEIGANLLMNCLDKNPSDTTELRYLFYSFCIWYTVASKELNLNKNNSHNKIILDIRNAICHLNKNNNDFESFFNSHSTFTSDLNKEIFLGYFASYKGETLKVDKVLISNLVKGVKLHSEYTRSRQIQRAEKKFLKNEG